MHSVTVFGTKGCVDVGILFSLMPLEIKNISFFRFNIRADWHSTSYGNQSMTNTIGTSQPERELGPWVVQKYPDTACVGLSNRLAYGLPGRNIFVILAYCNLHLHFSFLKIELYMCWMPNDRNSHHYTAIYIAVRMCSFRSDPWASQS